MIVQCGSVERYIILTDDIQKRKWSILRLQSKLTTGSSITTEKRPEVQNKVAHRYKKS